MLLPCNLYVPWQCVHPVAPLDHFAPCPAPRTITSRPSLTDVPLGNFLDFSRCSRNPVYQRSPQPCDTAAQTMYVAEWTPEHGWDSGKLVPYGPINMMPSAQVRRAAALYGTDIRRTGMDQCPADFGVGEGAGGCRTAVREVPQ